MSLAPDYRECRACGTILDLDVADTDPERNYYCRRPECQRIAETDPRA